MRQTKKIQVEAKHLGIASKSLQIVANASFKIYAGERVQIQGLNGEGKTALAKAILSLIPYTGSIEIEGKEAREYVHSGLVSYVPQSIESVPAIPLSDFLSLYARGNMGAVEEAARLAGISSLLPVPISKLSSGRLQMALIARALVRDARIYIFDDPFSSLDIENRDRVYSIIRRLSFAGNTVVLISYEQDPRFTPDRVITLSSTQAYSTGVVVKTRSVEHGENVPRVRLPIFIALASLLFIASFFVPSSTPISLRVLWAIVSGAVMSFTGAILQFITRNPLSSPYTLGIAPCSSFGSLAAMLLGIRVQLMFAFICGLMPAMILVLGKRGAVLYGIASASLALAALATLMPYAGTEPYARWMLGSFDIEEYGSLFIMPLAIAPIIQICLRARELEASCLDTWVARSSGINVEAERGKAIILSAVAISAVVSQAGPIAFIGLAVPNAIRRIYGASLMHMIPAIMLAGVSLALLSDILARIMNLYNMPAVSGAAISILGVPVLAYILLRTEGGDSK